MEKFKKIFCIFLMIILSISLTIFAFTLSFKFALTKKALLKTLKDVDYYNITSKNIRKNIKAKVLESLNDISDSNKEKLSEILSDIYIASLFPIDEVNTIYN